MYQLCIFSIEIVTATCVWLVVNAFQGKTLKHIYIKLVKKCSHTLRYDSAYLLYFIRKRAKKFPKRTNIKDFRKCYVFSTWIISHLIHTGNLNKILNIIRYCTPYKQTMNLMLLKQITSDTSTKRIYKAQQTMLL